MGKLVEIVYSRASRRMARMVDEYPSQYYREMIQRFIYLNPNYVPGSRPALETREISTFSRLMVNKEFILRLSTRESWFG